jgi:transposase
VHRHELSDAEWHRIGPLLPEQPGPKSKRGDREFLNAVIWRVRTGVPWRDLPERFGSWKTIYNRFSRWAKRGVWERIFKELAIDVDETGSLLDATIVRAHQDAAGGKGGSEEIIWAVLEEAFQPRSTRSPRPKGNPSTSRSRKVIGTRRSKPKS